MPKSVSDADQPNVRFGSLADICSAKRHVRFTPNSGHSWLPLECPLSANSGHLSGLLRPGRGQDAADRAVRVVRRAPEDVGKNVVVNVDSEGHGHISSSFGGLDHFGRAAAE